MDNRAWASGSSGTPPTAPASPSVGYPSSGNPSIGQAPTKGGAFWFHQMGEEMRNIITAVGMTPSTSDLTQLLVAIETLIEARSGNYTIETGAANAYVIALSPAIAAYTGNFSGSFKASHANTGASTLNAGGGAIALVNDVAGALVSGDIAINSIVSYSYVMADNKAYISSIVQSQADARYAALAGLATQLFSVAAATGSAHAINLGQFTGSNQSIAANGYQKLPGGLIIQWGVGAAAIAGTAITFPITFTTACYSVISTSVGGTIAANTASGSTLTGFIQKNANADSSNWIAIGK